MRISYWSSDVCSSDRTKASDLVCDEGHLEEMGGAFRAGRIIMPAVEDEPVVGHRADGLGGFEVVVLEPVGQRRPFAAATNAVYREGFRPSRVGAFRATDEIGRAAGRGRVWQYV